MNIVIICYRALGAIQVVARLICLQEWHLTDKIANHWRFRAISEIKNKIFVSTNFATLEFELIY